MEQEKLFEQIIDPIAYDLNRLTQCPNCKIKYFRAALGFYGELFKFE